MDEESEYKKLPIDEQCVHKLWKARVNGYEEATKLFRQIDDEKSPEWNKYLGLLKKFVTDSNAVGQEKGLEATLAFIENSAAAGKTVGEVMSGIVQKCIAAPKTKTRELAVQVTLMYIEIEKQEAVLEELLKGTEHKNPKIVAACVSAIKLALQEFGSKVVAIKPLVKKIPILLSDRDKAVRDEGKAMVVEMYRWVGTALKPQLSSLQPVQVTELETEFVKVKGNPSPTRYLRSQQQKQAKITAQEAEGDEDDDEDEPDVPAEVDAYELMDPVDILSKLPKDFYEKVEAKKWQERKEAMEVLEGLLKAPKLESGDYGDVVRALKKIIAKDTNVMVIALAGKCLAALATGLKKRFQPYAGACVPTLLEKFREKKQNVVLALREALDAIFLSTAIDSIQEDVLEALGNKNPAVKAETAAFLSRAFSHCQPIALNKKLLKAYVGALLKTLNEPDPTVRDNSAEALGTLMKLVGEKQIMPFMTDVDNLKMTKIKECCDKATILVKTAIAKKERPVAQAPASKSTSSTAKPPPKRPGTAAAVKKRTTLSSGGTVASKSRSAKPVKSVERDLSQEEVDEKASMCLPPDCIAGLGDTAWKTRLAAVEQFIQAVGEMNATDVSTQVLVRVIAKKPGLKDTNFQVLKSRLEAVKMLVENYTFSTVSAGYVLTDIVEKLGDPKNGTLAADTLTAISEATKFEHVANEVMSFAFTQKSPKVQQEALLWLSSAIKEFGFVVSEKTIVENVKKAVGATNPAIRTAGITLLGTLYLYLGPTLQAQFENERPTLKQQIDAEFDKYRDAKPPPPCRGLSKSSSRNSVLDAEDDDEEAVKSTPSETADPASRVDISGQITETLINELSDKDWKVRNEALQKINTIVTEAKSIHSSIGDLPSALVSRLIDSNAKIAQSSFTLCETLATAMGPSCKQHVRTLFPSYLQGLADSKAYNRSASISCINAWGDQCGYKEFFEGEMIADALKTGSPTSRIELWNWLAEKLPIIKVKSIPKEELMSCLSFLYTNLEDRNADVRKNAQEAVLGFMMHLGYDTMAKNADKLKPGSKVVVMAALEKVRPNLPVKPMPKKQSLPEEKVVKGGKPMSGTKTITKSKAGAKVVSGGTRKKEEDIDMSPLLAINKLKHYRMNDEQKLRVLKWNFVTPREEFVDLLKDQMTAASVNKSLMANMFHADFKYHLKAIEQLNEDINENVEALIVNLDLILKWLTLRFFDTNPSVLIKSLEYLNTVFSKLVEEQHSLTDNEAASFIPYLILKVGDPKETVRHGVNALFKQMRDVYPVSKLFTYLMDGLKSKNARQRTECLDELASIIETFGTSACQPSPAAALREVAKQISDRDNSVRNAALNCIVQAYYVEGDKIFKMVGQISDKDMSLLEERIKRASKTRLSKPLPQVSPVRVRQQPIVEAEVIQQEPEIIEEEPEPASSIHLERTSPQRPQQPSISGPFGLDMELIAKIEAEPLKLVRSKLQDFDLDFLHDVTPPVQNPSVMPISPPKRINPKELNSRTSPANVLTPVIPSGSQDHLLEKTIMAIASPDPLTSLSAITQMEDILRSRKANLMAAYEERFMRAVLEQMKILKRTNNTSSPEVLKGYRACMTVLVAFYESKVVGRQISKDTLNQMFEQLIGLLTDRQLNALPDSEVYTRVVNILCVRLIERSDHTNITCALIRLLHDCSAPGSASSRYVELVMKCLWKVVKFIPEWADELDYDTILLEIHVFFTDYPSAWWKQQPSDTPVRTIKTLVHAMAKVKGKSVLLHLTKIPNPNGSEVQMYLVKLLKTLKTEESKTHAQPVKKDIKRQLSRTTHNLLTDIFQKIGSKESTNEGLMLLYEFKEQHPEADVEPFLERSSQFFQNYIEKGLKDIAAYKRKQEAQAIASSGDAKSETVDQSKQWLDRLRKLQSLAGVPVTGVSLDSNVADENLNTGNLSSPHRQATDVETIKRRLEQVKNKCGVQNGN